MKKSDDKNELEKKFKRVLWITITCSLIIIVGFWLWNYFYAFQGEFGDKFGVINSLFSGLAFAGIIITILLQSRELKLQREELEETRVVFKKQSKIMNQQQKDATFFSLLENHRQLIDSFKHGATQTVKLKGGNYGRNKKETISLPNVVSGQEIISSLAKKLREYINAYSESYKNRCIYNFNLVEFENLEKALNSSPELSLHFRELRNLYFYVQNRLNNEEFYLETLEVNLTYDERFLFEIAYDYFEPERKSLVYKLKNHFKKELHVDFKNDLLPYVRSRSFDHNKNGYTLEVFHQGIIEKGYLIIYNTNNEQQKIVIENKMNLSLNNTFIHDGLSGVVFFIKDLLIQSHLPVYDFPSEGLDHIGTKQFLFEFEILFNGEKFKYYFGYSVNSTNQIYNPGKLILNKLYQCQIFELKKESLDELIKELKSFDPSNNQKKLKQPTLEAIRMTVFKYFSENRSENKVKAKDLMPQFIEAGIFEKDHQNGLPIREVLRDLDKENRLDELIFVHPERKAKNTNWYFKVPEK